MVLVLSVVSLAHSSSVERRAPVKLPKLYILDQGYNGCNDVQASYLGNAVNEGRTLIRDASDLLNAPADLRKSFAWAIMGGEYYITASHLVTQ